MACRWKQIVLSRKKTPSQWEGIFGVCWNRICPLFDPDLHRNLIQRLGHIVQDVINILNPHGQAHQIGGNARAV